MCKLPIRGLLARFLEEISVQALYKSSLCRISGGLLARSRWSWQDLWASSLYKTSLSRFLRKISLIIDTGTAPQRELSDRPKVPRGPGGASDLKMSTAAHRERSDSPKLMRGLRERSQNSHWLRHNESNLTRTKWREGCTSDLKIRTAPQRFI